MKCYHCETQITPGIDNYTWDTGRCGMPVPLHTGNRWEAESCYTKHKRLMKKEKAQAKLRALD